MRTSRRTPKKRPRARKKKRQGRTPLPRPTSTLARVVTRVKPRSRLRHNDVLLSVRCRVARLEPEAEGIILTEHVGGNNFLLPLPSRQKDGRHVRDLARLEGREVWLTLRLP